MVEEKSVIIAVISFFVGVLLTFISLFIIGMLFINDYYNSDVSIEEVLEYADYECYNICKDSGLYMDRYNVSLVNETTYLLHCECSSKYGLMTLWSDVELQY